MRRRIFIAINIPADIKKKIWDYSRKWPELPCRWTRKENLHITLSFLGYLTDEEMLEVCRIVKEVVKNQEPFFINFNKIIYGPPGKSPRMVWVEGEKSEELGNLQKGLEKALQNLPAEKENRGYSPHITLSRIKEWEFGRLEPEERLEVNEEISLGFEVGSVEVMESELKREGPEYTILESFPFGKE